MIFLQPDCFTHMKSVIFSSNSFMFCAMSLFLFNDIRYVSVKESVLFNNSL